MNKVTLNALKDGVRHWAALTEGIGQIGARHCALCRRFWHSDNCDGCPVAEKTGNIHCVGTPYHAAYVIATKLPDFKNMKSKAFKEKAEEEWKFLVGLLPPEVRKQYLKKGKFDE